MTGGTQGSTCQSQVQKGKRGVYSAGLGIEPGSCRQRTRDAANRLRCGSCTKRGFDGLRGVAEDVN